MSSSGNDEEGMKRVGSQAYGGELLTVDQVAQILNVNASTVRRYIKDGALPAIILPHRFGQKRNAYRIRRSDIDKLLEN